MSFQAPLTLASKLSDNFHEFDLLLANLSKPSSLARIISLTPPPLLQFVIQRQINELLKAHLDNGDFDFLQTKRVTIEIHDADLKFSLRQVNRKIEVIYPVSPDHHPDATLSLGVSEGVSLLLQQTDPDTLFFHRKLRINGSTELAHQLKNTLDTIDANELPTWLRGLLEKYQRIHAQ